MKALTLASLIVTTLAFSLSAEAACQYRRVCSIGGQCTYEYYCENNVPNPGHSDCSYQMVCSRTGCSYQRVCR